MLCQISCYFLYITAWADRIFSTERQTVLINKNKKMLINLNKIEYKSTQNIQSGWPSGLRRQTQGDLLADSEREFWSSYEGVGSNPTSDKTFFFNFLSFYSFTVSRTSKIDANNLIGI